MDATRPPLISAAYRAAQEALHRTEPGYGVASVHYAPLLAKVLIRYRPPALLDYGAGKGRLARALEPLIDYPLKLHRYDPAIPDWAQPPAPCQFVACIDVLEHVEPDLLDNVIADLARVTLGHCFATVHTGPARKVLADGRNAHLIQEGARWWLERLLGRFDLVHFQRLDEGFWVLLAALAPKVPRARS